MPVTTPTTSTVSLTSYAPQLLAETFAAVRTVEQAIAANAPKLAALAKDNGKALLVVLKLNIAALDKALKNKDGLTPEEIDLIAEEVLDKWGRLISFADIAVVFRDAKLGKYGETYQQLTAAKVVKWFDDYCEMRMEACAAMNRELDKMRFESDRVEGDDRAVLEGLGYMLDGDGRLQFTPTDAETGRRASLMVNMDRVSANDEKRAERGKKIAVERQKKIDADNEYLRWRQEYERNKTL